MSYLKLENVSVKKGNFKLENINFELDEGDFLSIIGKTGSGKTVLLETIAGIHKSKGKIFLEGRNITNLSIEKRKIGLVYQDFMLFEHLTVRQNLLFSKNKDLELYSRIVDLFDLGKILNRKPKNLSGGEKQKVAIARALISKPKLLLLDEPLSSIDFSFRYMFLEFIKDIHKKFNLTTVYVTHNLREALNLSNKCGVLLDGKLLQFGETEEVFERPSTKNVAVFLGFKNILPGELIGMKGFYFSVSPYNFTINKKGEFNLKCALYSVIEKDSGYMLRLKTKNHTVYAFSPQKPKENQLNLSFRKSDMVVFIK